jgi:hypothetical protein
MTPIWPAIAMLVSCHLLVEKSEVSASSQFFAGLQASIFVTLARFSLCSTPSFSPRVACIFKRGVEPGAWLIEGFM